MAHLPAHEIRGMANLITSTDSATQGSGTVLNQAKMTYNSFTQLTKEEQAHGGSVIVGTPAVQYGYDSGGSGSNEIRPSSLTYPNARSLTYDYGTAGGPDDRLNRVTSIKDGSTILAGYTYLGAAMAIRITYGQPSVWLDLWGGTSGAFAGLDLFGRIIDQRWQNSVTGTPVDIDRYKYGYDRDSNRIWKQNVVSGAASVPLDEFYGMDNLNRLATMQRGTLTGSPPTGISGTPVKEQDWTLDPTGNWRGYITKTSGTTDLNQSRTSSAVNEITNITESTGPTWTVPAYDAAGNTTTFPKPTPTSSFTATYDAWNRMTAVNDGVNAVAKYDYDGRNRRIISRTYTSGTLTETRHAYYTNSWQNVEERLGTNTTADTQHVWGLRYIDELVCRDDATPARIYACQDANFNVTCLTNAVGVTLQRFVYEPYGIDSVRTAIWAATTDGYSWQARFQACPLHTNVGCIFFRNRYLIQQLGRFNIFDLGYQHSNNLYESFDGNPISNIDPSGWDTLTTLPDPYIDTKEIEFPNPCKGEWKNIEDNRRDNPITNTYGDWGPFAIKNGRFEVRDAIEREWEQVNVISAISACEADYEASAAVIFSKETKITSSTKLSVSVGGIPLYAGLKGSVSAAHTTDETTTTKDSKAVYEHSKAPKKKCTQYQSFFYAERVTIGRQARTFRGGYPLYYPYHWDGDLHQTIYTGLVTHVTCARSCDPAGPKAAAAAGA